MTFSNIPGPIDGALVSSALLRRGLYAAIGSEGVISANDLKVSASSPAGQSLQVAPGVGAILNGYQTEPTELYIAANSGVQAVTAGDMPGSSPGTTYWMVALVVGDPQAGYSQTGHPFMPADFDEGQANTFQYDRIVVLPCASTDDTFSDLSKPYPGLALARIELPGSTTTVTNAMITDLRVQALTNKGRWDKVSTATLTKVAADTTPSLIPGLSQVIAVNSPIEIFDIDFNADVFISGAGANFMDLYIDGAVQGGEVGVQTGDGQRSTAHGMWTITGLSVGNHTFEIKSYNYTGSTGTTIISSGLANLRIRRA